MAIEQFKNNASSTLDGGIDDTVTSLDVASSAGFPTTGQFRILIESEIMLVTAVASDTFTVTRGVEGTVAASHSSGVDVTHILTAGALDKFVEDNVGKGAIGSRPSAAKAGRLYLPDDGLSMMRDSGSVWTPYGPVFKFKQPPALASFTGVNTTGGSTSVISDQGGIIAIRKPAQAGVNWSAWVKSAPSTPYTISAAFIANIAQASFQCDFGLCFRQAADPNKLECNMVRHTNITTRGVTRYSALTTAAADLKTPQNQMACGVWWFRIEDDGTNRKHYCSVDGVNWSQMATTTRTTHITADQVGFFVDIATGTNMNWDAAVNLLSWEEA